MALLRLQDTYALSANHLATGNVQGISDSMSMSGMVCDICIFGSYVQNSNYLWQLSARLY